MIYDSKDVYTNSSADSLYDVVIYSCWNDLKYKKMNISRRVHDFSMN